MLPVCSTDGNEEAGKLVQKPRLGFPQNYKTAEKLVKKPGLGEGLPRNQCFPETLPQ